MPMVNATLAVCSDDDCVNNANGKQTLCCFVCGRCGDPAHSHQDCGGPDNTAHGRKDEG